MSGWKDILGTLQSTFKISKLLGISASGLTATRTYTLPDVSGQLLIKNQFGPATLTNNIVATTETIIARWAIPANSLAALDNLDLILNGQVSGTATLTFRVRFGIAGTTADTLLATFTTSGAGVANSYVFANMIISVLTATTMTAAGFYNFLSGFIYPAVTAAFTAGTVNLTLANFLSVTLVQSAAQTYTSRAARLGN